MLVESHVVLQATLSVLCSALAISTRYSWECQCCCMFSQAKGELLALEIEVRINLLVECTLNWTHISWSTKGRLLHLSSCHSRLQMIWSKILIETRALCVSTFVHLPAHVWFLCPSNSRVSTNEQLIFNAMMNIHKHLIMIQGHETLYNEKWNGQKEENEHQMHTSWIQTLFFAVSWEKYSLSILPPSLLLLEE